MPFSTQRGETFMASLHPASSLECVMLLAVASHLGNLAQQARSRKKAMIGERHHPRIAEANNLPHAEKTGKNHEKGHAIAFLGAVSSRSGNRSIGYCRPYSRRRPETLNCSSGS